MIIVELIILGLIAIAIGHLMYLDFWREKLTIYTKVFYKKDTTEWHIVSKEDDLYCILANSTGMYIHRVSERELYPNELYWYYVSFIF